MNVILIQDVEKLGEMGDTIVVKDGYARNFLIPHKMAIQATKGALAVLEQKKRQKARLEEKHKEECQALAGKLANVSCTITAPAGEEDKLFGSVTSEMIAESLLAEGIDIDKRKIVVEETIKKLGVYSIEVKLHPDVKAQIKIWVVKA